MPFASVCRACARCWSSARTQPLAPGVLPFAAELDRQPGDRLVSGRRIERHEIASCFHTGGTTGLPKVAQHTHLNELADAWSASVMLDLSARDTLLCGLPLFHVNGVVVTGVMPFMVGAKVVLLGAEGYRSKTAIAHFWRNVERFRASFFSAVPTIYSTLLGVPIDGADMSSLRYAICGAAADAAGADPQVRGRDGREDPRGLRAHRGNVRELRQSARRRASGRLDRLPHPVPADEGRRARQPRAATRATARSTRSDTS